MSDTWKLVPVEPTEQMIEAGRHVKRMRLLDSVKAIREGRDPEELMGKTTGAEYRAMLEAAPAPPVPSSVQEIMRLMNPYVWACVKFNQTPKWDIEAADAEVSAAFKPLQAALTALVEKNHELQFSLDGVNAMRRLGEWQPIETAPKDEFILVGPTKRMDISVAMNHSRDGWVTESISDWHNIYTPTHWMPLPPPPTPGIEPEQGEVK